MGWQGKHGHAHLPCARVTLRPAAFSKRAACRRRGADTDSHRIYQRASIWAQGGQLKGRGRRRDQPGCVIYRCGKYARGLSRPVGCVAQRRPSLFVLRLGHRVERGQCRHRDCSAIRFQARFPDGNQTDGG